MTEAGIVMLGLSLMLFLVFIPLNQWGGVYGHVPLSTLQFFAGVLLAGAVAFIIVGGLS